jgi:putative PIN family toxin of toxin-antitoxin system
MTADRAGPPRVVIDTDVLIPILTYEFPSTNWLAKLWQSYAVIPLANEDTLNELEEKLREKSPTAREYPALRFVQSSVRQYRPWCEIVPRTDNTDHPQCRDWKDQKFIDLAMAGNTDFLITRDRDLLAMNPGTKFIILEDRCFRILRG